MTYWWPGVARLASLGLAAVSIALAGAAGAAQQDASFAGKRVEMIVPFPPAGGADVYARALAPFLEKHLPGRPSIIVRNIPGGGSITGANQFHARAKPDGLTVLVVSASTVTNSVFQRDKMEFDLRKAEPVVVSPQGSVFYASPALGVKGPQDIAKLKGHTLTFGGGAPTGSELQFSTAFELLGLNVKYVWGVARGPTRLAFERGEFNVSYDTTPGYLRNAIQLVKTGKAVPMFTLGVMDEKGNIVRDPNFPDLPTFPEAYETMHGKKPAGAAYDAWRAIFHMGTTLNKAIVLPAGTPPHIVEAWRASVRRVLADPEFEKHAATIVEGYPQFIGDAARPIIKEALSLEPAAWDWLKAHLKTRHDVTIP